MSSEGFSCYLRFRLFLILLTPAAVNTVSLTVYCNQWTKVISRKLLIQNDKNDYSEMIRVLQIPHYGIFDTDTVADYELKM